MNEAHEADGGSGAMFDKIADNYDLTNRIISLGIDRSWRRKAVHALQIGSVNGKPVEHVVLDLATGTADLAIAIALSHPAARVCGVDPSRRMLEIAATKLLRAGLAERVSLALGDAQAIEAADETFDAVSIAFGIRNVPDRPMALREMRRVTKRGGRIVILELAEPPETILGALARLHIHTVVPALGAALSGAPEYRYLERSIARFPDRQTFAAMMREAGLAVLSAEPLTFGVVSLYVAEVRR